MISAAKKIAEAGSRMDKLGRTIADHVSNRLVPQASKFILDLGSLMVVTVFFFHEPQYFSHLKDCS